MALSLLQRVATKALDTLGGAATSAINYLSKNAPHVINNVAQGATNYARDQYQTARQNPVNKMVFDSFLYDPVKKRPLPTSPYWGVSDANKIDDPIARRKAFDDVAFNMVLSSAPEAPKKVVAPLESAGKTVLKEASEKFPTVLKKTERAAGENAIKLGKRPKGTMYVTPEGTAFKVGEQPKTTAGLDRIMEEVEKVNQPPKKTSEVLKLGPGKLPAEVEQETNRKLALEYLDKTRKNPVLEGARKTMDDPLDRKTKDLFQKGTDLAKKWINTREGFTQWRAGDIKRTPALTQFDVEKLDAIKELQAGTNPQKYKAVKDFTDELFQLEKKAGVMKPNQYRQNYLPQLWDNTPEEIERVFQQTVGNTPGFSKSRILEDYKTGIEAGLKPRFDQMSDLLESRFKTAQKALADKEFVDNLVRTGNAVTLDKAPTGWQPVDLKYEGRALAVDPETAKMIQRYTSQGSPLLEKTAQFVSNVKQTILSAGIPKTGWNFHTGVNIPVRAMAARKNPFGAAVDSIIWNNSPKSAVKYIESVPKEITDGLLKNGLTISRSSEAGGYGFKAAKGKSLYEKGVNWFDDLFSEAAFDKVLPAHKIKVGWETYQNALKSGSTVDEAFKIAADTANTVFGGVNPAEMTKSKDFMNIMRTLLLAPDWLQSNIKIGKSVGGLLNPKNWAKAEYAPFKRYAANAAGMYSAFAMTNKAISGKWPWENGAGNEFNLATGTYDDRGRERMISVFGTAFDTLRIPLAMVTGALDDGVKGAFRPIRNRLSPPVASGTSLGITGEDYRGRPIDDAGDVLTQLASAVGVPSQATNLISGLRGETTPEETVVGLLEAPVRYKGGATTPEKRKTAELLKEGGASNKDINAALTSQYKGEDKGLASWFGGKNNSTLGATADGKPMKFANKAEKEAFDKSIDTALSSGSTELPDSAIITRFFDGKTYDKSARKGQQEILDSMLKVADDEYLTPEQKSKIANAAKIDSADLQYYRTASLDQEERLQGLLEYATSADPEKRDELIENLMLGKKEVGGKSMFSTSMYDRLYDEGLITKAEKALITAVKYDPIFNKFYMDRDYKGGGASAASITAKIKSVNSMFKKTIDASTKSNKQAEKLSKTPEAPKLDFKKAPKKSGGSTSRWFTQY